MKRMFNISFTALWRDLNFLVNQLCESDRLSFSTRTSYFWIFLGISLVYSIKLDMLLHESTQCH